jgi:4-amino-4-deoxy-L-arabinose transferase-like glycosyltransferase
LLVIAAVLLLVAPIRKGDLAGYDDAVYAHIAKAIVRSGDWINIQSNGYPALEHPPGFVWMQAALFSVFGFSDFLAKLPSALCGVGTVVLVYWLARRLLGDEQALLAMFVMLATPYFIKYTSHGMTDVPFTFLFLAAVCAWIKAEESSAWYWVVAVVVAYALLTRGLVGMAVPATLFIDGWIHRRKVIAFAAIGAAFVPIVAWYWHQYSQYGDFFWTVQSNFLRNKVNGDVTGSFRRYTGAFEYAWMLLQSYWPWLPFMAIGLWTAIRRQDRRLTFLVIWCAVMYAACSVGGSRVLRYLLPAYPAFSIFAAMGVEKSVLRRYLNAGLRWAVPVSVVIALGVALFPPASLHAEETKPIAAAARGVTAEEERIAFYDEGQPRFDETGQIQWYGDRIMWILLDKNAFENALAEPISKVWIIDAATFDQYFATRAGAMVVARDGHLVCVRLT